MKINVQFESGAETVAFAARELERYLSRMLPQPGVLDLRLVVDAENAPTLECWSVALSPTNGTLRANSPRALLLCAYDLLRRLGCRFLAPGDEYLPQISPDALALRFAHIARFRHRGVCIEGADSRENVLAFIDWLPKAGFNAFFLQFHVPFCFYARWYEHRLNPTVPAEPFTPDDARRLMREVEAEIRKRGLLLHKVGHGWTAAVLGRDSASWDEEEKLAAPLLPLAAEVNGRRGLFKRVPLNTNLCLSNPEAVARFVDAVADYARDDPDADYLHIWLADTYNNVCECEACRRTTPSDQYVELLNAIDARLTAEGLPTKLVFLLYQELLWPPVTARLNHPERFVLMFAPISRSFERSYDPSDAGGNLPVYVRNHIALPVDLGENLRFLRAWQRRFAGDSFIYDYHLGKAHYGDFGYLHIARIIFEDANKLRALGLNGWVSCQELRAGMPNFLPDYVLGRALTDEGAKFEEIVDEYFQALYGEGWETAKRFLEGLSECQVCDYVCGVGARTDANVAAKLARAQELCVKFWPEGDTVAWMRLSYHARYVSMLAAALRAQAEGDEAASKRAYGRFEHFVRTTEMRVQGYLDGYRVQEVMRNYAGLGSDPTKSQT